MVEPPWKPAKGRCVARNQTLEHHSPKPMSVNDVCFQTFIGCISNVEVMFSFAIYAFLFFLIFLYQSFGVRNFVTSLLQVVRYVVSASESSRSDSDDDNDDLSSLWNIPTFLDNGIYREDSN